MCYLKLIIVLPDLCFATTYSVRLINEQPCEVTIGAMGSCISFDAFCRAVPCGVKPYVYSNLGEEYPIFFGRHAAYASGLPKNLFVKLPEPSPIEQEHILLKIFYCFIKLCKHYLFYLMGF